MAPNPAFLPLAIVGLALANLAGPALARPAPTPDASIELIELRKKAERFEVERKYAACAQTYVQIYEKAPNAASADNLLYNAGVCYEQASLVGRALQSYQLLESRFPASALARKAMVRRANAAASIALFAQAAEAYSVYAARYAGEKDAPLALGTAVHYQIALGQDAKALEGLEAFRMRYGRKDPRGSAEALLAIAALHGAGKDEGSEIKTYQRYLKEVGAKGGADRLLVVHARLGELLWKRSCNRPTIDGACLRVQRPRAKQRRCGPDSLQQYEAITRRAPMVREARKNFALALRLEQHGVIAKELEEERRAQATYWAGAARFYMLEEGFERLITTDYPDGIYLAGDDEKIQKSKVLFTQWNRDSSSAIEGLLTSYSELQEQRGSGAEWALAAAARSGQLLESLALAPIRAEFPRRPPRNRGALQEKVHCQALGALALPSEEVAVAAYGFCNHLSKLLNWSNHWSALCESRLSAMRPEDYPARSELKGAGDALGYPLAIEALIAHDRR